MNTTTRKPNYIARRDFCTTDKNGIHYTSDAAPALTTIHCNRLTETWRRELVVEQHIPVEARAQYVQQAFNNRSDKVEKCGRKFDGFLMENGIWARECIVDMRTMRVVKCKGYTQQAPLMSRGKFGRWDKVNTTFNTVREVTNG